MFSCLLLCHVMLGWTRCCSRLPTAQQCALLTRVYHPVKDCCCPTSTKRWGKFPLKDAASSLLLGQGRFHPRMPSPGKKCQLGSFLFTVFFPFSPLERETQFLLQSSELQEGLAASCFLNGFEGGEHSIQQATRGQQWLELWLLPPFSGFSP